jgi:coenzyme PQQ biosynthesis protein PqqD
MNDWQLADRPVLAPQVRLQIDAASGEPVLLYPEGILTLNPTAHEIVSRCDGRTTIQGIVSSLAIEFEVSAGELTADVFDCLRELHRRRLMVLAP